MVRQTKTERKCRLRVRYGKEALQQFGKRPYLAPKYTTRSCVLVTRQDARTAAVYGKAKCGGGLRNEGVEDLLLHKSLAFSMFTK